MAATTAAYIVCCHRHCARSDGAWAADSGGAPVPAVFLRPSRRSRRPVAVASYAAAGIAEENPMKVGLQAVKLGITGFILPFAFALNPDYITFGWNLQTLLTWISGMVVCYSLAIMLQGYVESRITVLERLAYLAVIVLAITPYMVNSLIGFVLFAALYGFRKWQAKRAPQLASS